MAAFPGRSIMNWRALGRGLVLLTYVALAAVLVWRLLGLYEGRWASHLSRTRRLIRAAAAHDSVRLDHLVSSPGLASRMLAAARSHPEQFAEAGRMQVVTGERAGDTTRVWFSHLPCPGQVVVVTFRNTGAGVRIYDADLPCRSK
jgi:hypothetical protein